MATLVFDIETSAQPVENFDETQQEYLFREADNLTGVGIALTDLAWLALWEGRYEDSLRLEGASATVKDRVGGPPGGFAGILEGRPDEEARAHLPEDEADRAWEEGRAMRR